MTGTFTGGTRHGIAVGVRDRPVPRVAVILGGAAWVLATLQLIGVIAVMSVGARASRGLAG